MNPNKEYFIKMLLNDINKDIYEIRDRYDNTKIEFKIGDTVYYYSKRQIVKGKIVDIDDYSNGGLVPDALVYYWVTPKSILIRLIEKFRYRWTLIRKKNYVPGKLFFTNGILAGSDFFRNEKETETMEVLHSTQFYLNELLYLEFM